MSIITKTLASEIAAKLTTKKLEELNALRVDARKYFENLYLSEIDNSVLELFAIQPEYFNSAYHFNLMENGFNHERIQTINPVPYKSSYYKVPKSESSILRAKLDAVTTAEDNYKKLKLDVAATLVSLRTYKKVSESIPEAAEFLPRTGCVAVAVDFSDLRARLQ